MERNAIIEKITPVFRKVLNNPTIVIVDEFNFKNCNYQIVDIYHQN